MDDFDKWLIKDLKEYLIQNDINLKDIKGSGKNSNVIKKDYIKAAKIFNKSSSLEPIIVNIPAKGGFSIPDDIIYEILLNSDINTIKSYCLSKKYLKICNDYSFWKLIFNRDNLPILEKGKNTNEWINIYNKTFNVIKEINLILKLIDSKLITLIAFDVEQKDIDFLNIKLLTHKIIARFKYNDVILYPSLIRENGVKINYHDFKEFLYTLLYINPTMDILGANENSQLIPLRKRNLLTCINYYNPYTIVNPQTGRNIKDPLVNKYLKFYKDNKF